MRPVGDERKSSSRTLRLLTGRGLRQFAARPRLVLCVPAVAVAYLAMPAVWHPSTRLLIAWNIGTWLYVALTVRAMARATEASIRRHALLGDRSRFLVLTFCIAAAAASLAAIVAQLGAVREAEGLLKVGHLLLAVGTIATAFVFIHLVFTQHYAHEFFILRSSEEHLPEEARGGLYFPYTTRPTFADFAYYAFVIGCTCQTADVQTTSSPMRALTLIHGILSFFFNTTVLALTINISSGLF